MTIDYILKLSELNKKKLKDVFAFSLIRIVLYTGI